MTNLRSDTRKFLSHRLIGIGLGLALIPVAVVPSMLLIFFRVPLNSSMSIAVALGSSSFVLGFAGFQIYKRVSKVEFFPFLEFCSISVTTISLLTRGAVNDPTGYTAVEVFVVSGFFAIGVIALQERSKLLRICSGILFGVVSFFVFQNLLLNLRLLVPLLLAAAALLATGVVAARKNKKFLKKFSSVFFSVFLFFASFILIGYPAFHLMALVASVFTAVGIIGVYENKSYMKIGRCFRVLSLLCLVCVPLANIWYLKSFGTTFMHFLNTMIYSPLTLPLCLTSAALFMVNRLMIFHERSQPTKNQESNNTTVTEQEKFKVKNRKRGFSVMILSQLVFMLAALICALLEIRSWEFFTEFSTAFPFIVGVALFAVGPALILHKKPNRPELVVVVLGSVLLVTAAFSQFYQYYPPGQGRFPTYITPYSNYALPLFLVSTFLFAIGYASLIEKKVKTSFDRTGNKNKTGILEA